MIVVIRMFAGLWDLGILVALFGIVAVMNLSGLLMEHRNDLTEKTDRAPYWLGVLPCVVPWLTIVITFIGSLTASGGTFPEFVIYISIFLVFNLFARNIALQYLKVSRWTDYLFGEKMYILLSLVAKSARAWQVYFGTLNSPICERVATYWARRRVQRYCCRSDQPAEPVTGDQEARRWQRFSARSA